MIRTFSFEIQLVDGQVREFNGDTTNEDLQNLAHILVKLPDQYAELVIEYEFTEGKFGHNNPYEPPGYNDDPPEHEFREAYLVPYSPNIPSGDAPHIRIRPKLAYALFERYIEDIVKDSMNEEIRKIANVITEDPNVPNVYGDSEDDTPLQPGEFRPKFATRRLHRQILVVAKTRIEGAWSAYIFPVPGENHDEEAKLWQTEGVKLPENLARVMFPEFKDMKYSR
jgi:hypothetical protein